MFSTRPTSRRPLLLILVLGAFLVLVGITAGAQATMVSSHFTAVSLDSIVGSDAATVRILVNAELTRADLGPSGPTPARRGRLEQKLATLSEQGGILRVEVRRPDGSIVVADAPELAGAIPPASPEFAAAAAGTAGAAIVEASASGAGPGELGSQTVLREFLPVQTGDGEVLAVVGVWRDAVPILARLDDVRRDVLLLTVSAAITAAVLLLLVFRTAQARITRQGEELLAAARRDPLTGMSNHGALVDALAERIEDARAAGQSVGVAILDIDNFRLLNDHHGHHAGDFGLLVVAELLREVAPVEAVIGRYGPDEFLVVAPPDGQDQLEPTVDRLRSALVDWAMQFSGTEPLPLTVSAGIAHYPDDGASVTLLLAAAAATLQHAKTGGGDTVRRAEPPVDAGDSKFDVLQGLVFSVDTKDRYTKRHSEDVARYAVFLARELGLDDETIEAVHVAGLLHDVGKIGVPDALLRKPGRLTADEYEIIKHHVALGDMIVRDLPNAELVRAGVRNHHERWDGRGYLDGLEGEGIPLIGRILAVGDAFSAMTTTRPYRKAVGLREALRRIEDAAGSQLDLSLATLFVARMEQVPDAPLPGDDRAGRLWTPRAVA